MRRGLRTVLTWWSDAQRSRKGHLRSANTEPLPQNATFSLLTSLDPDTLRVRNPKLVYVGLHGFAEDGPYGGLPAYDDIIQGLSGCAGLMEKQSGTPQY
jgi:hypothetical protein